PHLSLTRESVDTALFLTVPPVPQSWGGRAFRLGLTLGPTRWAYFGIAATAMLPPWARRLYGGLGWPGTDLTADLSARGLRLLLSTVLSTIPRSLRVTPMREAAL